MEYLIHTVEINLKGNNTIQSKLSLIRSCIDHCFTCSKTGTQYTEYCLQCFLPFMDARIDYYLTKRLSVPKEHAEKLISFINNHKDIGSLIKIVNHNVSILIDTYMKNREIVIYSEIVDKMANMIDPEIACNTHMLNYRFDQKRGHFFGLTLLKIFDIVNKGSYDVKTISKIMELLQEIVHYEPLIDKYFVKISSYDYAYLEPVAMNIPLQFKTINKNLKDIIERYKYCLVLDTNASKINPDDFKNKLRDLEVLVSSEKQARIIDSIIYKYLMSQERDVYDTKISCDLLELYDNLEIVGYSEDKKSLIEVLGEYNKTSFVIILRDFIKNNEYTQYEIRDNTAEISNTVIFMKKEYIFQFDKQFDYTVTKPKKSKDDLREALILKWSVKGILRCFCCDKIIDPDKKKMEVEMGHIVPKCKGGLYDMDNLRLICISCNRGPGGMHTTHMHEYMTSNHMEGLKNLNKDELIKALKDIC